jgi:hypothetical protein
LWPEDARLSTLWARRDRARLERSGGALEQHKRPCLIGDLEFARQARRAAVGCGG